ncbi:hypothetical protein LINPERHAP2_LOCUS19479 [Linum perenne]
MRTPRSLERFPLRTRKSEDASVDIRSPCCHSLVSSSTELVFLIILSSYSIPSLATNHFYPGSASGGALYGSKTSLGTDLAAVDMAEVLSLNTDLAMVGSRSRNLNTDLSMAVSRKLNLIDREPKRGEFSPPRSEDYIYWPGSSTKAKSVDGKLGADKSIRGSNDNLAVVPWVAPQPPNFSVSSGQVSSEPVEAEESDMMD